MFASGTWQDGESARLRAGFRERFCEFDDGLAAERVVRTLMLGERLSERPGGVEPGEVGRVPAPAAPGAHSMR